MFIQCQVITTGVIYIQATLMELSKINLYYINNYIKRPWIWEEVEDIKGVRKRKGKLYNNIFHTSSRTLSLFLVPHRIQILCD